MSDSDLLVKGGRFWVCSFVAQSSKNRTLRLCVGLLASPQKDRDFGRVNSKCSECFCMPCESPLRSIDGSEPLRSLGSTGTCNAIAGFKRIALLARLRGGVLLDKWPSCSLLMLWKMRVNAWSISLP